MEAVDMVDILKIDIEGSELDLFSKNYESWLGKVKNIAIEIHDKESEKAFFNALSDFDYQLEFSGELTVCKQISRKKAVV